MNSDVYDDNDGDSHDYPRCSSESHLPKEWAVSYGLINGDWDSLKSDAPADTTKSMDFSVASPGSERIPVVPDVGVIVRAKPTSRTQGARFNIVQTHTGSMMAMLASSDDDDDDNDVEDLQHGHMIERATTPHDTVSCGSHMLFDVADGYLPRAPQRNAADVPEDKYRRMAERLRAELSADRRIDEPEPPTRGEHTFRNRILTLPGDEMSLSKPYELRGDQEESGSLADDDDSSASLDHDQHVNSHNAVDRVEDPDSVVLLDEEAYTQESLGNARERNLDTVTMSVFRRMVAARFEPQRSTITDLTDQGEASDSEEQSETPTRDPIPELLTNGWLAGDHGIRTAPAPLRVMTSARRTGRSTYADMLLLMYATGDGISLDDLHHHNYDYSDYDESVEANSPGVGGPHAAIMGLDSEKIPEDASNVAITRSCTICEEHIANVAFQCGHLHCPECARKLHACPVCRESVKICMRVDLPEDALSCEEHSTTIIAFQCGHMHCAECAKNLKACPICCDPIKKCIRVFM